MHSFLLLSNTPWYGYTTGCLFTYWRINYVVSNLGLWQICVQISSGKEVFISLQYMPKSTIAGLNMYRQQSVNYFPEWMNHFTFPSVIDLLSSCPHQNLLPLLFLSAFSCSDKSVVISHHGLICVPLWLMILRIFSCTYFPSVDPLQWNVCACHLLC